MLFSQQQTSSLLSLVGETSLELWIDGVEPALSVRHISVREQLSDLFSVTILARSPGHLFGYIVRGTAAGFQGDTALARRADRDFLSHYDAERRANRIEYREHEPAIEDFKQQAESTQP